MPVYEHHCNACNFEWLEEYSLKVYDWLKETGQTLPCIECESDDTRRNLGVLPVHFKGGGVGWADNGYYKYEAYDSHVEQGKKVEVFDRKEDIERVMKGEKREAMKKRLKREDELAKRHFGPDYAMTEQQANRRIDKEVEKVKVGPEHKK